MVGKANDLNGYAAHVDWIPNNQERSELPQFILMDMVEF